MKLNFFTFLGLVAGSGCGPRLNMIEKREHKQIYETGKYFDASKPGADFNAIYQKNLLLGKWRTIFTLLASNNDSIQYDDADVTVAQVPCAKETTDPECQTIKLEVTVKYSICRDMENKNQLALLPYLL